MSYVENIARGLGKLTPTRWRMLWDAIASWERNRTAVESLLSNQPPTKRDGCWAMLIGFEVVSSQGGKAYRWKYRWTEAAWDTSALIFIEKVGGQDYTGPLGYAYNSIENGNDGFAKESAGVSIEGPDYPLGFRLQAIRGDDGQDIPDESTATTTWTEARSPVVWLHFLRGDEKKLVPIFTVANEHDGECT